MTKNFFKIDTKKDDIMFNQDYVIINGCLMFHKSVACIGTGKTGLEVLQDKINNNISFNYKASVQGFIDGFPQCEKLLPEDFIQSPELYAELKNTGLTQLKEYKKSRDFQLYFSDKNNSIIAIDKRYSDFILENDLCIWSKDCGFSYVLTDSEKNIKGLICRCANWKNYDVEQFFKKIYIHNKNENTRNELSDFSYFKKDNYLSKNLVIAYN